MKFPILVFNLSLGWNALIALKVPTFSKTSVCQVVLLVMPLAGINIPHMNANFVTLPNSKSLKIKNVSAQIVTTKTTPLNNANPALLIVSLVMAIGVLPVIPFYWRQKEYLHQKVDVFVLNLLTMKIESVNWWVASPAIIVAGVALVPFPTNVWPAEMENLKIQLVFVNATKTIMKTVMETASVLFQIPSYPMGSAPIHPAKKIKILKIMAPFKDVNVSLMPQLTKENASSAKKIECLITWLESASVNPKP